MVKESTLDEELHGLIAQTELSDELNINPNTIRPCIAKIWQTGFKSGSVLNRSMASSILASEFIKLDYVQARVEDELYKWNRRNNPPLRQSEIRATIRTAIRRTYNYSCKHYFLEDFCIGNDLCMWSKGKAEGKRYNYRALFTYKWQLILKNVAKLIYWLALPEIEKRRGFKPGSKLYVSHRDIAYYAGISRSHVKTGLEQLFSYGLIDYKPGTSRRWEKNATEVRRIFPLPRPTEEALLKVTNVPR